MEQQFGPQLATLLVGTVLLVGAAAAVGATAATVPGSAGDGGQGNVSVYATDAAAFDDPEDVESALESGTLERRTEVVMGETLVVAIDSERLARELSNQGGSTTASLFAALDGEAQLTLTQTNMSPNVAPKVLTLDPGSTTAYRNGTTTYLRIETEAVDVGLYPPWEESDRDVPLQGGERFAVSFGYGVDDPYSGPEVAIYRTEGEFAGKHDVVAPERVNGSVETYTSPEAVTVRATLGNGSTITARPRAVPWSSSPGYSLNFRGVTPGTTYTLELVHDGEVVDRQTGTVRAPEASLSNPEVTHVAGADVDARLQVTANLSHGGKLIVRDGFGARVGSRPVAAGDATRLSVDLRFGTDGEPRDPDTLQVQAVRVRDQVEQRYPGSAATRSLDVSEYEWETADWTPESGSDDLGEPGSNDISPDDGETAGGGGNGVVGGGPSDGDRWRGGLPTSVGIVGLVTVLGGTGYLLGRRLTLK